MTAKPTKEKRYGIHVLRWATILASLLAFKQMSVVQFTGWAVVIAFSGGMAIGALALWGAS